MNLSPESESECGSREIEVPAQGRIQTKNLTNLQRGNRRLYRRRKNLRAWGRPEMQGDCLGTFLLATTIGSFGFWG